MGYIHEICMADDFSDDGTWEWMKEIAEKDGNIKIHRNDGPTRLGHTILYDTLVDMASNDIVMIYHADMYACPKMDEMVLKHLEPGKVVSATRIEPPLHPEGPEKVLEDFGIEPEEFKEEELLKKVTTLQLEHGTDYNFVKFTEGIFAPWAIYKEDFLKIGGHDPLYAPQSKEDSDIFNRFVLAGYELIQTWEGFVYHMTCRGSRFKDGALRNPAGQVFMKGRESSEWLEQNVRSTRNFIRKWGHMVKHDEMMYPIIPPKYNVGFVVKNCDDNLLRELEPWCDVIYSDCSYENVKRYQREEQPKTEFDLTNKIRPVALEQFPPLSVPHLQMGARGYIDSIEDPDIPDVTVEFDAKLLNANNFQYLVNLSEILADSGEIGEMELEIFKLTIHSLQTYEKELILVR